MCKKEGRKREASQSCNSYSFSVKILSEYKKGVSKKAKDESSNQGIRIHLVRRSFEMFRAWSFKNAVNLSTVISHTSR